MTTKAIFWGGTVLALLLSACAGSKVEPGEEVLLPNPGEETWWLWSIVDEGDSIRPGSHVSFLVAAEPRPDGDLLRFFSSTWLEKDSVFLFGRSFNPEARLDTRLRWPMVLKSEADSAVTWQMRLDRHSFSMEGAFGYIPFRVGSDFPKQAKMRSRLFSVQQNGWLFSAPEPRHGFQANLLVLRDMEDLMAQGGKVVSMDVGIGGGMRYMALVRVMDWGMEMLGSAVLDGAGEMVDALPVKLSAMPDQVWQSVNGKEYPLGYRLEVGASEYEILPRMVEQEYPAGRSSFWMGAIMAIASENGKTAGTGNMVILSH